MPRLPTTRKHFLYVAFLPLQSTANYYFPILITREKNISLFHPGTIYANDLVLFHCGHIFHRNCLIIDDLKVQVFSTNVFS